MFRNKLLISTFVSLMTVIINMIDSSYCTPGEALLEDLPRPLLQMPSSSHTTLFPSKSADYAVLIVFFQIERLHTIRSMRRVVRRGVYWSGRVMRRYMSTVMASRFSILAVHSMPSRNSVARHTSGPRPHPSCTNQNRYL